MTIHFHLFPTTRGDEKSRLTIQILIVVVFLINLLVSILIMTSEKVQHATNTSPLALPLETNVIVNEYLMYVTILY